MMQTGQQVTRLLGNTIALWMHVCNKCCTSKNYQQRISLQSFICRILELQRSELVELSLNILGKSILMRQASCDLKTSNASYICSICSALSRASSWLGLPGSGRTPIFQSTILVMPALNLSKTLWITVYYCDLQYFFLPESFANTISGQRDDSSVTHQQNRLSTSMSKHFYGQSCKWRSMLHVNGSSQECI